MVPTVLAERLRVLLIHRSVSRSASTWALPGGLLRSRDACGRPRKLVDETGG
jgi:ADP-ribose pyrophosphatase YjhB (NUDIX family)